MSYPAFLLQLFLIISAILSFVTSSESSGNGTSGHSKGIVIFHENFHHVATPFSVTVWVLFASLAKIVFHHFERLSSTIPESCLLILLGIPVGYMLEYVGLNSGKEQTILTSDLFFFYLLPPIILDAGYFMPSQTFYRNIGTILLYAVLGTVFNAFATGLALWGISGVANFQMSLLQSLLFGSLIAAVDPVAVLAVFEEVHVHEILYMLVFGESVLNDAASVVLYRTFEALNQGTIDAEQIALAFASFFVVSIGGALIGLVFALLTSFITKYTEHVRVIEPVFIFLLAYMSYLVAEIFHFSGIISILFCGIIMKPYVESNMSRKSHTTVKYFLKLLSSSSDSIIFMFFGASLVQYHHLFNTVFVAFTLLFITIFRALGVIILTAIANKFGRLDKVKTVEQFIMCYGGLRGAVAFCLAILIQTDGTKESDEFKRTIVTTTITVVMFTTFLQGTTIKKLVELLGVRRSDKRQKTMAEALNDRMLGYMVAGIEEIMGVHGHGFWSDLLELINRKFLKKLLVGDLENACDDNLLAYQRKMAFKYALDYANNPSVILARENDGETLNHIRNNPSVAMHLALKAQDEHCTPEHCGVLDINALSARAPIIGETFQSEAFNHRKISSIIPKAKRQHKRTYSQRKYSLNSLDEEEGPEVNLMLHRRKNMSSNVPMASRPLGRQQRYNQRYNSNGKKKKGDKHGRRPKGHSKPTEMSTVPEYDTEDQNKSSPIDPKTSSCSSRENSESEDESGIVLNFKEKGDENSQSYFPSLPSYDDSGSRLPDYTDQPILDTKQSTSLAERDKENLFDEKKWHSQPVDSIGVVPNDAVLYIPESSIDSKETKF